MAGRLDEMFAEAAHRAKAAVEPAPSAPRPDKAKLIEKMLKGMGVPTTNVKLNAWLTRHVGTSQIEKGVES